MLIYNNEILREKFIDLWEGLNNTALNKEANNLKAENTRNNMITLYKNNNGQKLYLHSKYDPVNEAEIFISQYKDIDKYEHIIFYGIGLAYHIEAFQNKFPHKPYSIYEPFIEILSLYLSNKALESLNLDYLKNLIVGDILDNPYKCVEELLEGIEGEVLLIMLPSYERAFSEEYKSFYQKFGSIIEDKRTLKRTNKLFEKLWVTNIMKNFGEIIDSPNILHLENNVFKGKPAILVSAGPSLEYELENLRYIKEKGLAYIFSVGSAINTLVEYDIYPDAALTYDPQNHNPIVFKKMLEKGIKTIPMVFGTISGYGTAQSYTGPKLHFINSKDTIAPYFFKLEDGEEADTVFDAGSIAVAGLQLLHKLGADPIILVGQNLAYKDKRMYSAGIDYGLGSSELDNKYLESSFMVKDVEGKAVYTSGILNHYRQEIEKYIGYYEIRNIINTTKGGAAISGTIYSPLEDVMKNALCSSVVTKNWYEGEENSYDIDYIISKYNIMNQECHKLIEIFGRLKELISAIGSSSNEAIIYELFFIKFHEAFMNMLKNEYFKAFVYPMNYYQCGLLNDKIKSTGSGNGTIQKIKTLCREFGNFIDGCTGDIDTTLPLLAEINDAINENRINVLTFTVNFSD